MKYSILLLILVAGCASYPVKSSLESAAAVAIKKRFGLHEQPTFVANPKSCISVPFESVATMQVAELESPTAPQHFKSGVFVLCDVSESGGTTHATLQRILHNASLGTFVVSESGEVELTKSAKGWRVIALSLTAIDYAHPSP